MFLFFVPPLIQEVMEDIENEKVRERGERVEEVKEVQRNLFMKDGTPFNINQPRIGFTLDDQRFPILFYFQVTLDITDTDIT